MIVIGRMGLTYMNAEEAWEKLEQRYKQLGAEEELESIRSALNKDKQQALERQLLDLEVEGDYVARLKVVIAKIEASNRELESLKSLLNEHG